MRDALSAWRPHVDEEIERLLPRDLSEEDLDDLFGEPRFVYDTEALNRALVEPVWDLLDRGGKRWRPVLFMKLLEGVGEDPLEYLPYAVVPEILHTGTIIVDDVEDEATLRRGDEAIHHKFGTDIALNAGNALYFIPLKIVAENPADLPPDRQLAVYEMLTHELNRTHLGQGTDIVWHNQCDIDITEDEYLEMSACKTGCLGRIAGRLAALVSEQSTDVESAMADYAESLSIAFQIGDDILDVKHSLDEAGDFGKEFGNDVREGKRTLMVIHAIRDGTAAQAARLEEILNADEVTDEEVYEAIDIMEATDSVEYARERALELAADARSHLDRIDLADDVEEDLREFTRYVIDREH
ncbi:MAG: polyprenyl synthetase family protein [Halanaeroarchaeum sp.]